MSLPTWPSCQGLSESSHENLLVPGSPQLVQEHPVSKRNSSGRWQPCQGSPIPLGHLSGLTTWLSAQAPPLLTPKCTVTGSLSGRVHSFACLLPPNLPTASPAFSLSHCPRGQRLGVNLDGISFRVRSLHFSRNKAPILKFQLFPGDRVLTLHCDLLSMILLIW